MPTQGVGRHPHADTRSRSASPCRHKEWVGIPMPTMNLFFPRRQRVAALRILLTCGHCPKPAVRAVEADDGVQTAEISSSIPMPIHISKMLIFADD